MTEMNGTNLEDDRADEEWAQIQAKRAADYEALRDPPCDACGVDLDKESDSCPNRDFEHHCDCGVLYFEHSQNCGYTADQAAWYAEEDLRAIEAAEQRASENDVLR